LSSLKPQKMPPERQTQKKRPAMAALPTNSSKVAGTSGQGRLGSTPRTQKHLTRFPIAQAHSQGVPGGTREFQDLSPKLSSAIAALLVLFPD
jgi:hypothetical protein